MIKYLVGFFILLNISCNKSNNTSVACFKGKLVLKGVCMNYVIQITEGDVDKALYESSWQNPLTNTTYQFVFVYANLYLNYIPWLLSMRTDSVIVLYGRLSVSTSVTTD